jgi:acyl-CoA hydrolase
MEVSFRSAPSVTVSVDDFKLNNDVRVGELVEVVGVVNRAFNTSMEV